MIPQKSINGLTFYPIPEFDDASIAFGASENEYFNRNNIPEIPSEYEDTVQSLFFNGGKIPDFHKNVDRDKAVRAIKAWLGSWAPAHEAKIGTVAYALWLWTNKNALDDNS